MYVCVAMWRCNRGTDVQRIPGVWRLRFCGSELHVMLRFCGVSPVSATLVESSGNGAATVESVGFDWVGFADSIVEVMDQKLRIKLGSLIHSIIGNLKPSIIHIRYEDLGSNPGHFGRIQHRRRERQQQRATTAHSSRE
ncbi:hypothetical protein F0562_025540 [Nyssa sinensis]|uniref:Uncharacterized protein n=1 Tax=Nyssa sinensis TaxID=561372 RepID=A0A5J5B887_9ASTE|nr:hypothetical protein F0562_025540 [Nyssa sinensis]